jgi:hypothetical protein
MGAMYLVLALNIFHWEEKLIAPFIATPNVDKCNRRQTRKGKELGYMLCV